MRGVGGKAVSNISGKNVAKLVLKKRKFFMNKILSLKSLVFWFSLVAFANSQNASDQCCPTDQCCQEEYNCGDPLNCGSVNFLAHVGVAPTTWRDRGNFSAI